MAWHGRQALAKTVNASGRAWRRFRVRWSPEGCAGGNRPWQTRLAAHRVGAIRAKDGHENSGIEGGVDRTRCRIEGPPLVRVHVGPLFQINANCLTWSYLG